MTIGDEIKKQRLELGWSREAVAMGAIVSEMHLYRLENNLSEPRFNSLKRIVEALQGRIEVKFNAEYNKDNG